MPMFFRTFHRPAPQAFHPYGGLLPFLSLLDINDDEGSPSHPCGQRKSAEGCEGRRAGGCGRGAMRGRGGWGPQSRSFVPNFNVVETEQAFELEGELPGLSNRDNVTVEWKDGQTLVISGKIDRRTPPHSEDEKDEDTNMETDDAAAQQLQSESEKEKTNEKQVTFRDAAQELAEHDELEESVFISRPTTPGAREELPAYQASVEDESTPETITDEKTPLTAEEKGKSVEKLDEKDGEDDDDKKRRHCHRGPGAWRGRCGGPAIWAPRGGMWGARCGGPGGWGRRGPQEYPGKKFHAHERRAVGEFTRSFTFGANIVDHEAVSATLKDGLLKVVVPKRAPLGAKTVEIQ